MQLSAIFYLEHFKNELRIHNQMKTALVNDLEQIFYKHRILAQEAYTNSANVKWLSAERAFCTERDLGIIRHKEAHG